MKLYFIFFLAAFSCKSRHSVSKTVGENCYKGKLEIKAGCMNYTISVTEGKVDSSLVQLSWTDENTGKSYKNAFALQSKCNFPDSIKEGDEFYFKIDTSALQNCAVCLMYYPVPSKKLSITVLNEGCVK